MTGRHAGMLAVLIAMAVVSAGCDAPAPAAAQSPARDELEARIKALESLLPSQSHMMADVGAHFANLWFAGTAENWPLADFYLNETRSHLGWAVRRIPIRKDNKGRDIDLGKILEAFETSQLTQLKRTIDGKDKAGFETRLQGEPDGLLLLPQGGRQALSPAPGPGRARVADHELRPQGELAPLTVTHHPALCISGDRGPSR